jgi:hypothetical protein
MSHAYSFISGTELLCNYKWHNQGGGLETEPPPSFQLKLIKKVFCYFRKQRGSNTYSYTYIYSNIYSDWKYSETTHHQRYVLLLLELPPLLSSQVVLDFPQLLLHIPFSVSVQCISFYHFFSIHYLMSWLFPSSSFILHCNLFLFCFVPKLWIECHVRWSYICNYFFVNFSTFIKLQSE